MYFFKIVHMKTELNVALIQTDLVWDQSQANRKQIEAKMSATSLSHIVNFDLVYVTYAIVCITAALIK